MNINGNREESLKDEWKRVEHYITDALEYADNSHNPIDIFERILDTKLQLWSGEKSAMVTEIEHYPNFRVCRIFLAGGDMTELLEMEKDITKWAKSKGCNKIQIAGRKGWERVLKEYKKQFVVLNKDINE